MRLTDLLQSENENFSLRQYRRLKRNIPMVVTYQNGEPQFRDKPTTRTEAVKWLRCFRTVQRFEKKIENPPKRLVLSPKGEPTPPFDEFLMRKFNISEAEI